LLEHRKPFGGSVLLATNGNPVVTTELQVADVHFVQEKEY
jgi:hypothetical protein